MASGGQERRNVLADGTPVAGVSVGDRVSAAADELYQAAPEEFTSRRTALAATARAAGDRAAATAIGALRKPTRAAWVVNRMARGNPSALAQLAEIAAALRAAQQAGHGPRLRELSAARGALVDALTAQALDTAGVTAPPVSLSFEVAQTLTAATVDPDAAAAVAAARLTRAVQWSGFGVPQARQPREGGDRDGRQAAAHDVPAQASAPAGVRKPLRRQREKPPPRQAEQQERLAREAAEHAALRQERYERAQRALAEAVAATASAEAAEDRLEGRVRDLEQRLTEARADLATARARARRAESAERRARQELHHLPGE